MGSVRGFAQADPTRGHYTRIGASRTRKTTTTRTGLSCCTQEVLVVDAVGDPEVDPVVEMFASEQDCALRPDLGDVRTHMLIKPGLANAEINARLGTPQEARLGLLEEVAKLANLANKVSDLFRGVCWGRLFVHGASIPT